MSDLKTLLPEVKESIPLAPYTSLRIGGPADYLFEAKTSEELVKAFRAGKQANVPVVVFGGGTNILVSDAGFRGLVILARNTKIEISQSTVHAEAGAPIGLLVHKTTKEGLGGLEWAAGLPGTVGGAVFGNAGTFGKAIGDVVGAVEILTPDGEQRIVEKEACGFSYRTSNFKRTRDLILAADLSLTPKDPGALTREVRKNIAYRTQEHPPYQSAGCIFKNTEVQHYHRISLSDIEGSVWFDRLPSGLLIDRAGLKGFRIGDAEISDKHGNFVMNRGHARAEEVVMLISAVKGIIHRKFGVLLDEEVRYIGFANPVQEGKPRTRS